jgi:Uma2 family endonuclease
MSSVPQKRSYKLEEYVALEADSSERHEYYRGEIFLMAGGSVRHGMISGNIYHHLRLQLKGKRCQPFISDQRVAVKKYPLHTYADVFVVCGEVLTDPTDKQAIANPQVLFEVLSPSTEKYDRGEKFAFYRSLPSLREYIFVAQDQPHIERFVLQSNDKWLLHLYDGLDREVELTDIDSHLEMRDIYEGVTFGELKIREEEDSIE